MAKNKDTARGQRIRALRERLGYERKEFAELFGAKPSSVTEWEKGDACPSPDRLREMAKLGGTTYEYLRFGESPSNGEGQIREPMRPSWGGPRQGQGGPSSQLPGNERELWVRIDPESLETLKQIDSLNKGHRECIRGLIRDMLIAEENLSRGERDPPSKRTGTGGG